MSYHVYLFARRTRTDNEAGANPDWLEDDSTLTPFSPAEREALVNHLTIVGFAPVSEDGETQRFQAEDLGAEAVLTDRGLYLAASGMDGVFEIGMLASELAGDGETFAKLDPQDGTWEP